MLKTILKYDLQDCFRQSLPLLTGASVLATLGLVLLYFCFNFSSAIITVTLTALYALCMAAMSIAIFIAAAAGPIRYYKSLFTDEGYLTMSIPVSTTRLVNAKLLGALVYECSILLFALCAYLLSVVLPIALYDAEILSSLARVLGGFALGDLYKSPWAIIASAFGFIVEFLAQNIILLTSITLGSLLIGKQKVLGAIGFFVVTNMALGLTEIILGWIVEATVTSAVLEFLIPLLFGMISILAVAGVLYFINMRLMTRRFNIL